MEEVKTYKRHTALKIYDISRWLYLHNMNVLAKFFYRINNVMYQCSIAYESEIDKTVRLCHAHGLQINKGVYIGPNTVIFQNVAIGAKYPEANVDIKIGSNCILGANACVFGELTIGDNVHIGANTVVLKDIPSNSVVIGSKATIIKNKETKKATKKKTTKKK